LKRFAYQYLDGNCTMTNVWKVRRIKHEQPHLYNKLVFKSTHKKESNRRIMSFVERKPNNYFKYLNTDSAKSHEGHDVTLTHEICQKIISELEILTFQCGDDIYKIYVSDCEIEKEIKTPQGNYFVDIFVEFNKSEPESLVLQWNGKVAIEIFVTNPVAPVKVDDLYNVGINIIQVRVSDKLKIDESTEISEEEILQKENFIAGYFRKVIYGRILKKYYSKEYLEMKEIEELKSRISLLEKQMNQKNDESQQLVLQIKQLNVENDKLRQQKNDLEKTVMLFDGENKKLKESFWYKLSNLIKR